MMILHSLKAANFKKFRDIDLRDLPARGLVGVLGPNEGGKSTVVDAMTFALFGRTPSADSMGLESVIHWEEELCQVEMIFELPGGARYRLYREIDRMGDHLAQLERLEGGGALGGPDAGGGGRRAGEAAQAMANLKLDAADEGRLVSGALRVARELQRLLGYTYDDFRSSFYLAQHAGRRLAGGSRGAAAVAGGAAAAGGAAPAGGAPAVPDWSGILFRMTGIGRLDRAQHRAEGVARSIQTELRSVENELDVQGRVIAALGVERDDEPRLVREIEELEAQIVAIDEAARGAQRQLEQAQRSREQRSSAARELGGLALAVLRDRVASKVLGLAGGLARRRETLAAERAAAESQRDAARRRSEAVGGLRRQLAALEERLETRRQQLELQLGADSPQSVVDEREEIAAHIRRQRGRGKGAMALGIILLVLALVGGVALALGPAALPVVLPITVGQLQGGAIGLALLGLILLFTGNRRRARSQQLVGSLHVRLEDLDDRVARLMRERQVLGRATLELVRAGERIRTEDGELERAIEGLRDQHRDFIERDASIDDYATALKRKVDEAEVRLRHLDATNERLAHLAGSAATLAGELRPLVRVEPEPEEVGAVDLGALEEAFVELKQRAADLARRLEDDARPAGARVAALRRMVESFGDPARERLAELEGRLSSTVAGDEGERHLVARIDAVLDALPDETELAAASSSSAAAGDEARQRGTELRARLEGRREQRRRLAPQFEKRRAAEEEIQALVGKVNDLRAELERERAAARLLQGTAEQLRSRLAPALGRSLGNRLGRITGGRYGRVNVDSEFAVHVFSDERNDFVDPVELSGGTHDQLLLALRLAFAEVLLAACGRPHGPHLLLLDEPLESFDATRARALLRLLREGSGALSQVFLLANQEQLGSACDLTILTAVEAQALRASGAGLRGAGLRGAGLHAAAARSAGSIHPARGTTRPETPAGPAESATEI